MQFFRKLFFKGETGREKYILLILAGILLLVIVWPLPDNTNQKKEENVDHDFASDQITESYEEKIENRLSDILRTIQGAGEVKVMVTLKSHTEKIVEKDNRWSESGSQLEESTIYDASLDGTPFVKKELEPEIEGVLVVASGADQKMVVQEITYAVQVLFDVPVHKIKVVKMGNE